MQGKQRTPRVVFQPTVYEGVQRGIDQIVSVIRPTLGPRPRFVGIERVVGGGNKPPEVLDSGGVIARRVFELPNRSEDIGAMFVRDVLCRLHDDVGDGTATAAVLFQSVYSQGLRYVVSGCSPMRLRHYLEQGMRVILDELSRMTVRLTGGKDELAKIAESICYEPPLAKMLGEIFDIIGEYGRLEVRKGTGRVLSREYVEGSYWGGGLWSRLMITDQAERRAQLENAAILVSDLTIEDPRALVPVLATAIQADIRSLVIMAGKISNGVIGMLVANNKKDPAKFQVIAVKAPGGLKDKKVARLQDLGVMTGARPLFADAGDALHRVQLQDLGRARRAWADFSHFGIVAGGGDPRQLRAHIANLRTAHENADDPDVRKQLQERLGMLRGGSATLWVGGVTQTEIDTRQELAKSTADALRGAVREGVLPGGGTALLACRSAAQRMLDRGTEAEECAAYRILLRALEEPLRTIVANAGYDTGHIMAEIQRASDSHPANGSGFYGLDVTSGQVVDLAQAGVFDVASVQKAAVHSAIASAALALTIDVLVQHAKPETAPTPRR